MMAVEDHADQTIDVGALEPVKILLLGSISDDAKDTGEIGSVREILTRLNMDLAYSSEKLVNMDILLMHILAWGNDLKAMVSDNDSIPVDSMEKALTFDLLYGFLDSEVRELDNFTRSLKALIVDGRNKISSCAQARELVTLVEGKLHDSEELFQQAQDHLLEMKMHLAKLQLISLGPTRSMSSCGNSQVSNIEAKMQMQAVERRHILRMLEESLAREIDLKKKLTEVKQNEEDLKVKLRLTEQVACFMEEAAEFVWGRFLEAENAAEVLMGISKEMLGRFQIVQFNSNVSIQQEDNLKSKFQACFEKLKAKETEIESLNISIGQLTAENSEMSALRDKVKLLEEQLRESKFQLDNANASYEASKQQLREMDRIIESQRENIYEAESRAESAEAKVTQLTETNLELTEELGFVKGNDDSNTKKVTLLEQESRELVLQLQHARASSEASQEQQNMLYSAIWDMETLIDELKQKVAKAESKTESAEQQCLVLSSTNLELNKELDFLRARVVSSETSLNQANDEKIASAKDITVNSELIMDMVMQLAIERESIQKRLYSLKEENKVLIKRLGSTKRDASGNVQDNEGGEGKDFPSSRLNSISPVCTEISEEVAMEPSSKSLQVENSSKDAPPCKTAAGSSASANNATNLALELEVESAVVEPTQPNQIYIFVAILVLLLSALTTYILSKKPSTLYATNG